MRRLTMIALGMFVLALSNARAAQDELKALKPEDKVDVKSEAAPKGAVVLFDGKSLDGWLSRDGKDAAPWKLHDSGSMEAVKADIISKEKFSGNFTLYVEFRVPYEPGKKDQANGNSGVYVCGRHEVQILNSYGLKSAKNDCGAIYGIAAPVKNVCKLPNVWQNYKIIYQSPKCVDGKKTEPAVMTVYQNGELIHDKVKVTSDNTTAGLGGDPCTPGPILLQYHGSPVQFRNIWLLQQKED